jgi:fatty acid desaturase
MPASDQISLSINDLQSPQGAGTALDMEQAWATPGPARRAQMSFISKNEGPLDRAARVIAGVLLLALAATGTLGAWAWIGVVPLATGLLGWCPLYTVLRINTCRR